MKLLASVLLGALLLWVPARADEASKNTKIDEMMKLLNFDQMMKQMSEQMKTLAATQLNKVEMSDQERKAAQDIQVRIAEVFQDRMVQMKPMIVKIYAETFTEEEIDGILSFYKSPAGQAMVQKMPQLMQRSMAVGQQMMGDVMPEIQKMIEEAKAKEKAAPAK